MNYLVKTIVKNYNLPYSKELLLETISIGCSRRTESVRFSNFFCEYIARKVQKYRDVEKNESEYYEPDISKPDLVDEVSEPQFYHFSIRLSDYIN